MRHEAPRLAVLRSWHAKFYWQPRWTIGFLRFRGGFKPSPQSKYSDAARSFDSILNVGPLHWRIYRESRVTLVKSFTPSVRSPIEGQT